MDESPVTKAQPKKNWTLNQRAFGRLLTWLDDGADSEGKNYLEMRRRLTAYFDRKNCPSPDELADETLSRVARRIDEEETIESESTARYCYIVARFVFMEHLRGIDKNNAMQDELRRKNHAVDPASDDNQEKERRLGCLDACTAKLETSQREMIVRYYLGSGRTKIETRRALADGLGISLNALTIRACRIREKLEACVRECLAAV